MNKINNKNKGITLIALVITIIVMLILVAVTISMAVNGGLFDYAGKATGDTQNAIDAEQELASGKVNVDGKVYNSIDDYLAGKVAVLPYDETTKDENGLLTANASYTSGNYTAVIPKGFAVVPGLNGTTTIADGLVITDELDENGNSIGNEFVWVPVVLEGETQAEKEAEFEAIRTDGYQNGLLQTYVSKGSVTEPFTSGYTNEEKDYNEMKASIIKNGGFYIGRFEAGSTTPRKLYPSSDTTITDAQRTTEMVVKRDAYPYNYVGWGASMTNYTDDVLYTKSSKEYNQGKGALYLSKALYANKNVGVTSTLCYGVQWDAMLDFIKDEKNIVDSTTWGVYQNNEYTVTRTTAQYYTPYTTKVWTSIADGEKSKTPSDAPIFLTTGADDSFSAKNIFDVAGNMDEWTNEAYPSTYRRSIRGGTYGIEGSNFSASSCYVALPHGAGSDGVSFRCALYIK